MENYLRQSYPLESICNMMFMNERNENYQNMKRGIAFSFDNNSFWRDPANQIIDSKSLEKLIQEKRPTQIHFESLHFTPHYTKNLKCKSKELVFDIDVTDYERFCHCLSQDDTKRACSHCWQHIEGTSLILQFLLEKFYGIKEENILWILSGMKGIHCIVNDGRFLTLTREQRSVLYRQINRNTNEELMQFASLIPRDFSDKLSQFFEEKSVVKRSIMNSDKFQTLCLTLLKSEYLSLFHTLTLRWFNMRNSSSLEKWRALRELEEGQFPNKPLPSIMIALKCYYPRIDKGPLTEKKHLFKTPFSIHTKTRRIALPVEWNEIQRDGLPERVLTLTEVNNYYYKYSKVHPDLTKSINLFDQWLKMFQ